MNDIAPGLPPIDDDDLLAGEYVLGVLDADARREAQHRIGADRDFAARVARWDAHLKRILRMSKRWCVPMTAAAG